MISDEDKKQKCCEQNIENPEREGKEDGRKSDHIG